MVNSLKIFAEGSAGPLGLAVVPALSWHAITDVISRMKADLPAVDVTLSSPSPWRAMEMLREGTADIAAILVDDLRRFSSRHSKEFDIFDWGRVPIVAALPRNDIADESPLKLTDFNETTLVIPRRMAAVPSLPEAVDAAFYRQNIVPSKMRTTETFNEALTLVEAGIAVSLVPDAGGKSLSRFNVTTKTVSPEIPPLAALILTRRGDQNRNSVRTFLHASGV
jgi:DNA-binding transcriptional LysR family regulator